MDANRPTVGIEAMQFIPFLKFSWRRGPGKRSLWISEQSHIYQKGTVLF